MLQKIPMPILSIVTHLTCKRIKLDEVMIMADTATTKLSSKGQVIIAENIRRKLKLEAGGN